MERNRLKGSEGDKVNAVLSAAGMNSPSSSPPSELCGHFWRLGLWPLFRLVCPMEPTRRLPDRLFRIDYLAGGRQPELPK